MAVMPHKGITILKLFNNVRVVGGNQFMG